MFDVIDFDLDTFREEGEGQDVQDAREALAAHLGTSSFALCDLEA